MKRVMVWRVRFGLTNPKGLFYRQPALARLAYPHTWTGRLRQPV